MITQTNSVGKEQLTTKGLRFILWPVMSAALLRQQLPIDDWILLPTPDFPQSRAAVQQRFAYGRFVRHIFFDIGHGSFTKLSSEHHKIVLDYCRKQYEEHVRKCQLDGRKPMIFRNTGGGYIRFWKFFQKGLYLRCDVPRRMREYQEIERTAEVPELCKTPGL